MKAVFVFAVLASATAYAKPTNGAFVGIHLEGHPMACLIHSVEPDSNAAIAGVEPDEPIVAVDGKDMTDCDEILAAIGGKSVGESIALTVRHRGRPRVLHLEAGTREEVLRRRFVGKRMPPVVGQGADGDDLQIGADRLTVYLFYSPARCMGCAALTGRIGTRIREHVAKTGDRLGAFAIASGDMDAKRRHEEQSRVAMPLAYIDDRTYELFALDEAVPAVQAYVVDSHDTVQSVYRIGPTDDDVAARLDELLASAAQVAHPR